MLPIKYQSTWKVCCRIIEIIRREMIILSSSSRRRRKRKSVFLRGGVVSHYHLSSRIVEHLYHVVQLLLYLPASVLPPFLSFSSNTTPRAARFPRVFQSREKERERERVEGVRFHWGWLVERDESVDRNGLMAWKSRPTDAFRRGPDRWAPSRFWREPWPFTILGWKFEHRHRNGFDSILIFSKYRMKSIHFLHFLS